jgi:hypothetical protein
VNPAAIKIDYNLDTDRDREWQGPGVWIVSPVGSFSWQQTNEAALRKQSILIKAGGRIFVNEEGGPRSKAGRGFIMLQVGANCTAEELAVLEEWREAAARGERPLAIPTERLPRIVLERRVAAAEREVQRIERVPPPDTEEAARLFSSKVKCARSRLAALVTTIEARSGKPKRAVQAEKSA